MLALVLALLTSPYGNNYAPHAVTTAGSLTFFLLAEGWAKPVLPVYARAHRWPDYETINMTSPGWLVASDVGAVTGTVGTVGTVLGISAAARMGAGAEATNALVVADSIMVAALFSELTKYAFRRPRPALYRAGNAQDMDEHLSFPSLHTAFVAAGATAGVMTWHLANPGSRVTPWLAVGAGALTALTATGRVLGGQHFISDVLAGAAIGVVAGYVVPTLSRSDDGGNRAKVFTVAGVL